MMHFSGSSPAAIQSMTSPGTKPLTFFGSAYSVVSACQSATKNRQSCCSCRFSQLASTPKWWPRWSGPVGRMNFSYPIGEYTSLLWNYRLEHYTIFDVDTSSASDIILDSVGDHTASVLGASVVRDTTNGGSTTLTTRGTVNSISVSYGGGVLAGTDNFIKGIYDSSWYHPVIGDLVFHWHVAVGPVVLHPLADRLHQV